MKRFLFALAVITFAQLARAEDPVASFEAFISQAKLEADGAAWSRKNTKNEKWVHAASSVASLRYDVRKTDSLVTPVIGEVTFLMRTSYGIADSDDRASARLAYTSVEDVSLIYAWKVGKWQLLSGTATKWGEGQSGASYAGRKTEPLTNEGLANPDPAHAPWYRPQL